MTVTVSPRVPLLATSDSNQDRILGEFLDKNKIKDALSHIDKRLKKQRKDGLRLQVMQHLLRIQDDRIQHGTSETVVSDTLLERVSSLAELRPQIAGDPECAEAINEVFRGAWSSDLWKQVHEKQPMNEYITDLWFECKFCVKEYKEAAVACSFARKHQPQNHHALSWKIILCYFLASTTLSDPEEGNKLGTLCGALVNQAVQNTPPKHEQKTSIRTQEDLELVTHVWFEQGKYEQLVDLLDDEHKGLGSKYGSWDLAKLKADALSSLNRRKDLWAYSYGVLNNLLPTDNETAFNPHCQFSEAGDDATFYEHLVRSSDPATHDQTVALLRKLANSGHSYAHTALALSILTSDRPDQVKREASKTFWDQAAPVGSAYNKNVIAYMTDEARFELARHAQQVALESWTNAETSTDVRVAYLKMKQSYELEFLLTLEAFEKVDDEISEHKLRLRAQQLACESIWMWMSIMSSAAPKATADNGLADDSLLFAARICVVLYDQNRLRHGRFLTLARVILETLVSHSRHNYKALILLIRICIHQGASTKAIAYYERLEIKNLQYVTEAGLLLRGLSPLHPTLSVRNPYAPIGLFRKMHKWIESKQHDYDKAILKCIDEQNWLMAIHQIDMIRDAFQGSGATIVNMELRRLQLRNPTQIGVEDVASAEATLIDLADQAISYDDPMTYFESEDIYSRELYLESKILDEHLYNRCPGGLGTAFWSTIIDIHSRRLIRNAPFALLPEYELHIQNTSVVIVKLLQSLKCGLDVDKILENIAGLNEWLSAFASEALQNVIHSTTDITVNDFGAVLITFNELVDDLRLIEEAVQWVKNERPICAPHMGILSERITTIRISLASWAARVLKPGGDHFEELVETTIGKEDGPLGLTVQQLAGEARFETLLAESQNSAWDSAQSMKAYCQQA